MTEAANVETPVVASLPKDRMSHKNKTKRLMLQFTALGTWNLTGGEWWQYFMDSPYFANVLLCTEL